MRSRKAFEGPLTPDSPNHLLTDPRHSQVHALDRWITKRFAGCPAPWGIFTLYPEDLPLSAIGLC